MLVDRFKIPKIDCKVMSRKKEHQVSDIAYGLEDKLLSDHLQLKYRSTYFGQGRYSMATLEGE